jgi:Hsp70 protein
VSGLRLAVDYGTSFTSAAIADGSAPEVLEFSSARHSRYLPSLVVVDQRGEMQVGTRAVAKRGVVPASHVCVAPKRQLGPDPIRIGAWEFESAEIVAATIAKVTEEVKHRNNGELPAEVVMTHPAMWTPARCEVLRAAAARAGLVADGSTVRLVSEPVAAVNFYAFTHVGPEVPVGGAVAVYDLGGGTFDCAVLCRVPDGWALAGPPGGDERLGGEDFDEALLEWAAERMLQEDAEAWDAFEDDDSPRGRSDWIAMTELLRSAKEDLSSEESVDLNFPPGRLPLDSLLIHRAEFTRLIAGPLDRSMDAFAACLAAAGVSAQDLAAVYLTGGSSRIPAVKSQLHRRFGLEPITFKDPKAITALGALTATPQVARPGGQPRKTPPPADSAEQPSTGQPAAGSAARQGATPTFSPGQRLFWATLTDAAAFRAQLEVLQHMRSSDAGAGQEYRNVCLEANAEPKALCLAAGTTRRVAIVTTSTVEIGEAGTVSFDPDPLVDWLTGSAGHVRLVASTTHLHVEIPGRQPLATFDVAAAQLTQQPGYGFANDLKPLGLVKFAPAPLLERLQSQRDRMVNIILTPTVFRIDGLDIAADGSAEYPVDTWVERDSFTAALGLYGTVVFLATTHNVVVLDDDDSDNICTFWTLDPGQTSGGSADAPALLRITPKAIMGGMGARGTRFWLRVDGIERDTDGWKPLTLDLRPGLHVIEACYYQGNRQRSMASANIQLAPGQELRLTYQQPGTTLQKGRLVLG